MSRDVEVQEVVASGDPKKLREKLIGLLEPFEDGMGMPVTIYVAQVVQGELQRIAVEKLEESSNRLEKLTKVLIVLTVVLMILAIPPAVEVLGRVFGAGGH